MLGVLHPALPAKAQDRPHAYFVLIDTSSSMSQPPEPPRVPIKWTRSTMAEVQRQLGDFCAMLPSETEVRVFTFDRDFRDGPHVVIAADQQREELRQFFAALQPTGKATFAWSSLNRVLGKAAEYVEAVPGGRVRVLMYTDGEDNEEGDAKTPTQRAAQAERLRKILKSYEHLLKDNVETTYVTLGFTIGSEVGDVLAEKGVRLVSVLDSIDLLPLTASFDWEPRRPTTRDTVRFIDLSTGAIKEHRWVIGQAATATEKAPQHQFHTAGQYRIQLAVTDVKGRTHSTERSISIAEPAPLQPMAKVFPGEVRAGAQVQFVNESQGTIVAYEWAFGDGQVSSDANPTHAYSEPGTYSPTLTVIGPGNERKSIELTAGCPRART